jgi:hypothetical protein
MRVGTMKARQLIEGAVAFDPDQIKIITAAFEEAWSRIEPAVSERKAEIDHVRYQLAKATLSVAAEGIGTSEALIVEALKRIAYVPR